VKSYRRLCGSPARRHPGRKALAIVGEVALPQDAEGIVGGTERKQKYRLCGYDEDTVAPVIVRTRCILLGCFSPCLMDHPKRLGIVLGKLAVLRHDKASKY
jgi:hypothetical protein